MRMANTLAAGVSVRQEGGLHILSIHIQTSKYPHESPLNNYLLLDMSTYSDINLEEFYFNETSSMITGLEYNFLSPYEMVHNSDEREDRSIPFYRDVSTYMLTLQHNRRE